MIGQYVAAIDNTTFTREDGTVRDRAAQFTSLEQLASACKGMNLRALWVTGECDAGRIVDEMAGAILPAGWRVFAPWVRTADHHEVALYHVGRGSTWDDFAKLQDARELLLAVRMYEDALKHNAATSPAATAAQILYESIGRQSDQWLDVPEGSRTAPEGIQDDLIWSRAPEMGEGTHVHNFDMNSAYLAVCHGMAFGVGAPQGAATWNEKAVGCWQVTEAEPGSSPLDGKTLPAPFTLSPSGQFRPGGYWTPRVKLALRSGWKLKISGGLVFPETHYLMNRYQAHMWDAIQQLSKPGASLSQLSYPSEAARRAALQTAKQSVRKLFSWFNLREEKHEDAGKHKWYYRPQWRGMIVSELYRRQLDRVWKIYEETGARPLSIRTDAITYTSKIPDATLAYPQLCQRPAELGGYKVVLHA